MTDDNPGREQRDDLDAAVHALFPAAATDPDALHRVRTRVMRLADTDTEQSAIPRRAGVRRWPALAIAAAITAVVMTVAAVAVTHRRSAPAGAMVEVAQTLNTAADAQIRAVDVAVPAGQYRYLSTHALNMSYRSTATSVFAVRVGARTETWIPTDPAGEWTSRQTDTGERTWLIGTAAQAAPPA